jgi:hypothetical protein
MLYRTYKNVIDHPLPKTNMFNYVPIKYKQMSFVSNGGKFKLCTVLNGLLFSTPTQSRISFEHMMHVRRARGGFGRSSGVSRWRVLKDSDNILQKITIRLRMNWSDNLSKKLGYFFLYHCIDNFQNCATMNCQRNVNSILTTQLPHKFS